MKKMNIKEESSTNVHLNSKKAQTALALAVSLWIGGAGVAMAEVEVTSTNAAADATSAEAQVTAGNLLKAISPVKPLYYLKSGTDTALKIAGGDCTNAHFAAGFSNENNFEVTGYTLTVNSGTFKSSYNLVGGWSNYGTAKGNHVYINGGQGAQSSLRPDVYGGSAYKGANGNTVDITDGSVNSLYGGSTTSGDAEANIVTISGGNVGIVRGGSSTGGVAKNNEVTISGGTVIKVYGGYSNSGVADHNTVKISDGTVSKSVFGGWSGSKDATYNEVNISGGAIGQLNEDYNVYGGFSDGAADNNKVKIFDGTIYGQIYGGYGKTGANNNEVEISGGTLNASFYGGCGNDDNANATGNIVKISGGTIGTTSGHGVYGGQASNGAADNNTITISGGTLSGSVWGGNGKTATGNTVNISGGTFAADAYIHGGAANGDVTNNKVNILKLIAVGGLVGGESFDGGSSTGNTLNQAAKGVTTGYLGEFQNLNFYLPTDMSKTDTMLNVSGTADVDGAKVGVLAQGTLTNLVKNDKVTLLHANTLNGTVSQTTDIDVPVSIAKVYTYEFNVTSDTNNIYATITKAPEESTNGDNGNSDNGGGSNNNNNTPQDHTKSLVETKAATTTFINAGADILASQGFEQAANAVALETAEQSKNGGAGAPTVGSFTPFAAMGGSSMRAESGSYVDTKGFGLNLGFAREIANGQGKLLFGPLVEYGGGSYDSYLDSGTHGEGGSHYFGVGLMARQINRDGFYYEGSLRGGRVTSDYKSFIGQDINYDTASNYLAAHVGVGKVYDMGNNDTLDGYLKYFYSHQAGDDVTIHASTTGDAQWSFDAVNSHRIRIGARLTHKINEKNSYYGGLAYQYEFGGDATAHYNGGSTPSPSVKGSSGMLELGWQVKPGNGPLTLDLGLNGWVGKQRGGSVQMGATWSF